MLDGVIWVNGREVCYDARVAEEGWLGGLSFADAAFFAFRGFGLVPPPTRPPAPPRPGPPGSAGGVSGVCG